MHERHGGFLTRLIVKLSVLALLLSACGGGEDPAPDDAEETPTASEEPTEEAGLVIDGEEIADAELWEAAQEEGGLTIYTSITEARFLPVLEHFEEEVGIDVEHLYLPGGRLFERIQAETASDVLAADVITQTDLVLVQQLQEDGVFEQFCPVGWDALPEELKDPDCSYWAAIQAGYVIIYNNQLVEEADAPESWDDLLDPQWSGQITMPHIGTGGSGWSRDLWLRQTKGIEYWEALAAQSPRLVETTVAAQDEVERGETQIGLTIHSVAGAAIAGGAPFSIVWPEEGVPGFAQWAGLAAGAENSNAGKVLLNWLSSQAGQTAIAELGGGDFPIRSDVPGPMLAGEAIPSAEELGFVNPEPTDDYHQLRESYAEEWFRIFNFTP